MCQSRALPALDLKGSLLNDTIEAGTLECHGDLKRVLHPSRKELCLKIQDYTNAAMRHRFIHRNAEHGRRRRYAQHELD